MKLLRTVEIVAWTLGVSMLVTYAASRSWFAYGHEQGIATFDATGTHALSGTVPAGLAGTKIKLWAAAIDANGHVVRSATELLWLL